MSGFEQMTFDDFDNGNRMCPVLVDPDPDCYCFDLSSMKIPRISGSAIFISGS
jgi:hypothetical protein